MNPSELEAHVAKAIAERTHTTDPVCRSVMKTFNQIYYGVGGAAQVWWPNSWRGVQILKCPEDLFIYQEIIHHTNPDVIIETGVAYGGSSLFLADMCDLMGHAKVVAIDVTLTNVHHRTKNHPGIRLIEGDSTAPSTFVCAREHIRSSDRVMVVLDSDHTKAHVFKELELYAPLVTLGCYLIVEDTNINGHPVAPGWGNGPYEAVDEFLETHPEFERDLSCERLLVTFNPGGYLKRIA
jgi:cephalosporin hydroxylase